MNPEVPAFLRFLRYKNLDRWDIKSQFSSDLSFKFPTQKLRTFLTKSKIEWVDIEDDKAYPILGVHAQGEGVYINKVAMGRELKMKHYQRSKVNTLFYCKVRTVKGQWGIVTPEFADSFGSSNMQYLDIDFEKIDPGYFINLLKLKRLTDIWDKNAIGADGRHFTLKTMLGLQIPIPDMTIQKRLISQYNVKKHKAEVFENEAVRIQNDIETYLLSSLGIYSKEDACNTKTIKYSFFKLARFKDITRWDVAYYSQKKNIGGKYKTYTLNDCIENFMQDEHGDSLRIETYKTPEKSFQYIGMEDVEKDSGHLIDNKCIHGRDVKSQTIRVPLHYYLYGKLRPYLNKYWFNDTGCDNIVCSSEFFVFSIKDNINKDYFRYFLSSSAVQHQIQNMYQGARMPRINEETFKAIQIPIPPKNIQESIVKHINGQKAQIKQLKQQAESLRKAALIEFEKEIFE